MNKCPYCGLERIRCGSVLNWNRGKACMEKEIGLLKERVKRLEEAGDEAIYKTNLFDREAHWNKAKEINP